MYCASSPATPGGQGSCCAALLLAGAVCAAWVLLGYWLGVCVACAPLYAACKISKPSEVACCTLCVPSVCFIVVPLQSRCANTGFFLTGLFVSYTGRWRQRVAAELAGLSECRTCFRVEPVRMKCAAIPRTHQDQQFCRGTSYRACRMAGLYGRSPTAEECCKQRR